MNNKNKIYVISLGGSLIVPKDGIDWKFLKKFRELIIKEIADGNKFFLISGGGSTSRQYTNAASKIVKITPDDLDWLGIHATRLNAHLLRTIFRDIAHPEIIKNPTFRMPIKSNEGVIVAGGWKPGWSTDYVATMIAQEYDIKTVINLSNIDYVYDQDPRSHKDAKKIEKIHWSGFRKIVGDKWDPGLNAPFDPVASQKAEHLGLKVIIMNGKNIANLKKYLDGKKFIGTVIEN
jgi:uridylate kinase